MVHRSLAVVLVVGLSSNALGQMLYDQAPPQHRIVHRNTLALRYNPLGLIYDGRFMYRLRLYESDSKALRDNFLGVGVAPTLSPAFMKVGPYVELNPLTVFGVWAAMQVVQYFGSFNLLQSYPDAHADFSDTAIRNNGANRQTASGWELTLGANLTLKFEWLLLRSQARLVNGNLAVRAGDTAYYDQYYDALVPNHGWTFSNDLDVLFQGLENKLIAGARYTATIPLFGDPSVDNGLHRVGPFVGYTFKIQDGATFNTPTVFILVQWWVKHRWRTGVDSSPALPMLGAGFQITGDFLPIK